MCVTVRNRWSSERRDQTWANTCRLPPSRLGNIQVFEDGVVYSHPFCLAFLSMYFVTYRNPYRLARKRYCMTRPNDTDDTLIQYLLLFC